RNYFRGIDIRTCGHPAALPLAVPIGMDPAHGLRANLQEIQGSPAGVRGVCHGTSIPPQGLRTVSAATGSCMKLIPQSATWRRACLPGLGQLRLTAARSRIPFAAAPGAANARLLAAQQSPDIGAMAEPHEDCQEGHERHLLPGAEPGGI